MDSASIEIPGSYRLSTYRTVNPIALTGKFILYTVMHKDLEELQ
jgi:hypothetical protein